jgi:hypothetical protein
LLTLCTLGIEKFSFLEVVSALNFRMESQEIVHELALLC